MPNSQSQQQNPACPRCSSKFTIRKGRRKNRFRALQVIQCGECLHKFTAAAGKNKTYPPGVILETVSTYARLRVAGRKLLDPEAIIRSYAMRHKQVYRFGLHRAKLELLLGLERHGHLAPAKDYLEAIGQDFPHHIFQTTEHRSSKFPTRLSPPIVRKENYATRLAALVLPTSPANKKRHETLQRFMLVNDTATVAVEIPVYLTGADIAYYRDRGFKLDFENDLITGHIDFLQVRDGGALSGSGILG